MSDNFDAVQKQFQAEDAVARYDKLTGGVTAELGSYVLKAIKPGSLSGKAVLDNACGTGVITKQLLKRSENVKIEAADLSETMVKYLRQTVKPTNGSTVTATVMDATSLTFSDNSFDYTITLAGIQLFPDVEKAWRELYRVTKPAGKCCVTIWQKVEHKNIAERVLKRMRGENATFDITPAFWTKEREAMELPEYLPREMAKQGFKDCMVETHTVHIWYPGEEGIQYAMEGMPGFYTNIVRLQDGEEEKWKEFWKDELLKGYQVDGGIKIAMVGNIGWGTK